MKKKFSQNLKTQLNKWRNFIVFPLKTPEASCLFARYLNQVLLLGLLSLQHLTWCFLARCQLWTLTGWPGLAAGGAPRRGVLCHTGQALLQVWPAGGLPEPDYPFSGSSVTSWTLKDSLPSITLPLEPLMNGTICYVLAGGWNLRGSFNSLTPVCLMLPIKQIPSIPGHKHSTRQSALHNQVTSSDLISDLDRGWWDDEQGQRIREEADCTGSYSLQEFGFYPWSNWYHWRAVNGRLT